MSGSRNVVRMKRAKRGDAAVGEKWASLHPIGPGVSGKVPRQRRKKYQPPGRFSQAATRAEVSGVTGSSIPDRNLRRPVSTEVRARSRVRGIVKIALLRTRDL